MSTPQKLRDLGKVADGRIRKGSPFAASGGPLRTANSKSKGLYNPKEQCYRNAVLQCLLHTPEFFRYLNRADRCTNPGDNCVFCALRGLTIQYWTNTDGDSRHKALAMVNTAMENHAEANVVYEFLRPAGSKVNNLDSSGQQDAFDYFLGVANMLKHINNDMLHMGIKNVAIDRLFRLRCKLTWVCDDCGKVHARRDKNTGLNLAMPNDGAKRRPLEDCIVAHFADEQLGGVRCDSDACNDQPGDRVRKTRIVGGPEILVIQLVRMSMDLATGQTHKVMDHVDSPERLDLSPWSEGPLKYQLNGVVLHMGKKLTAGHYIALVRSQTGPGFVLCNDEIIVEDQVLAQAEGSYMLVYQKIGGKMAKCI